MKRWLAIFLVILLALMVVSPAAADSTPTPTPAPTSTPVPEPPMSVTISITQYLGWNILSGNIKCRTIEGGYYEITGAAVTFTSTDFVCLGDIVAQANGFDNDHLFKSRIDISANVTDTVPFYYDADSQAVQGYFGTQYGPDPNAQGVTGTGTASSVAHGGIVAAVGPTYFSDTNDTSEFYIYFHDSVKAPCSSKFQNSRQVATGTIAATNEAGVMTPLTIGSYYKLTVSGGPWNDGSIDRYDTAIKIMTAVTDPDSWTSLSDYASTNLYVQCTEGDPTDANKTIIYFQATDTNPADTFYNYYIRVNDTTGQFANNTGSMSYEIDEVSNTALGCQTQYLQGNVIESGTILATNSAGNAIHDHPLDNLGAWWTGNWIEIVTSGGPWQDGGVAPDRYDVAIKNPDGSWSPLSSGAYTACSTTNGNYAIAYYQLPDQNGIYLRVNDTGGSWTNNTGAMDYAIYAVTYSPNPASGCAENFQMGTLIKTVTATANIQTGVSVGDLGNGGIDVTQGGESDLRYYAIETSGIYFDGSKYQAGAGIASNQSTTTSPVESTWSYLQDAPGVVCAVPLDPIGHIRVYLPLSLVNNYWVRAQALGISQNWPVYSGSLTFSIYKATDLTAPGYTPGPMPGATVCDSYYTKGTAGASYVINGSEESGVSVSFTSGHVYGIETSAGPWHNNGVDSYEVAISEDGGGTWTNLVAFAASVCAESPDGNHLLVYFQALAGRSYRFRVYDPGDDYTDNTGSINIIRYDNVVVGIAPWSTCGDNYSLVQVTVPENIIPTSTLMNNTKGPPVNIPLTAGASYAIEISQASGWYVLNASPQLYYHAADISKDNGSNWTKFGPDASGSPFGATCVLQTNQATDANQATYRVYFTAGIGAYQMQIDATGLGTTDPMIEIRGNLNYILYQTSPISTQNPPVNPPGSPIITPPEWNLACYEKYLRPSGFFEETNFQIPSINLGTLGTITFPVFNLPMPALDQWISYLEWSVRSYFAWCAEDTAALGAIPTTLNGYEPFGTIADSVSIMRTLQSDVTSAQTAGGASGQSYAPYSVLFNTGGGADSSNSFQGILPVLGADSPWTGGQLKWGNSGGTSGGESSGGIFTGNRLQGGTSPITALAPTQPLSASGGSVSTSSYYYYCTGLLIPHVGQSTAVGECAALALAKTAPLIWILVQLLADAGALFTLFLYIQKKWVDGGASG